MVEFDPRLSIIRQNAQLDRLLVGLFHFLLHLHVIFSIIPTSQLCLASIQWSQSSSFPPPTSSSCCSSCRGHWHLSHRTILLGNARPFHVCRHRRQRAARLLDRARRSMEATLHRRRRRHHRHPGSIHTTHHLMQTSLRRHLQGQSCLGSLGTTMRYRRLQPHIRLELMLWESFCFTFSFSYSFKWFVDRINLLVAMNDKKIFSILHYNYCSYLLTSCSSKRFQYKTIICCLWQVINVHRRSCKDNSQDPTPTTWSFISIQVIYYFIERTNIGMYIHCRFTPLLFWVKCKQINWEEIIVLVT